MTLFEYLNIILNINIKIYTQLLNITTDVYRGVKTVEQWGGKVKASSQQETENMWSTNRNQPIYDRHKKWRTSRILHSNSGTPPSAVEALR